MANAAQAKPIVKWAGGKQALAAALVKRFPDFGGAFYEPFLGGGSVLLEARPCRAVVGDLNDWLLDTYQMVRDNWQGVADALDKLENTKDEFLRIRKVPRSSLDRVQSAAHFIYLNKTCFRGLFRVNRKGEFNVPYGEYRRRYYNRENLAAFSETLCDVTIRPGDFELCLHDVSDDDFVYLDPPYFKLGGYSDFNRYTPGQFRVNDHIRLAALCRELDKQGVRWAISNSDTDFIRHLFEGYPVESINTRREINLNSRSRNITELLIKNY